MKYIEEKSRSGVSHKKFTSEFGAKVLGKYGWSEGEGLGENKNGITEAIQIKRREENIGIGKKKKEQKWNDKWWENNYNTILNNREKVLKLINNEFNFEKNNYILLAGITMTSDDHHTSFFMTVVKIMVVFLFMKNI